MKKVNLVLLGSLIVGTSLFADGAALYSKCATCHGPNGERAALGASKIIKDMSKADFIASMKGYQDGSYGGAKKQMMEMQVKALSDADIEALAAHIVK
jgi:cytochrome c553